jgi:hypothetical protein
LRSQLACRKFAIEYPEASGSLEFPEQTGSEIPLVASVFKWPAPSAA